MAGFKAGWGGLGSARQVSRPAPHLGSASPPLFPAARSPSHLPSAPQPLPHPQAESLAEALWRVEAFAEAGADILFVDALESEYEMRAFCRTAPGVPKASDPAERSAPCLLTRGGAP